MTPRWLLLAALVACHADPPVAREPVTAPPPPSSAAYLSRWPGLSLRVGDDIVDAPAADQAVARAYPTWPAKGAIEHGMRLTIMTAKISYTIGEEVRVVHVFDATAPGRGVYVMGPKVPWDEWVDGARTTGLPELADYPWVATYDGVVLPSPALDYNYDVTVYRFATPGDHTIEWRLGGLRSNPIHLAIGPAP